MIGAQWEIEEPTKHKNVIVYASDPWEKDKSKVMHIKDLVISAFEKELTEESESEESYESDYE